jgi:hypothetical protein
MTVIQEKRVWNVDWDTTYPDLFIAGFPRSLQSNTETVPHLGHYVFLPLLQLALQPLVAFGLPSCHYLSNLFVHHPVLRFLYFEILRESLREPQIDK